MLTTTRSVAAVGGALLGLVLLAPAPAQALHGVTIQKVCAGPTSVAKARPGDTVTCRIKVTNRDTFDDTLRVDQIYDVIDDAGGPTTTPNLLQTDLGLPCAILAPGASVTVTHQFQVGDPENDPLESQAHAIGADLRNAGGPVPAGCPGGGFDFALSFGALVDVVECLGDPDCLAGDVCSVDTCDASNVCLHTPAFAGTSCRAPAGVCDLEEKCTGADLDCPADGKSTAVCRPAAGVCDLEERCDGASDDCPPDAVASAATVCRSEAGPCDVAELCTGSGVDCPADAFRSSATVCRAAGGGCDVAEHCTGSGPACPPDVKSTDPCRAAAGICDVAERCDGVHDDCPADAFAPSSTVCRPSNGVCDPAEHCTGGGPLCPPEAKSTDECRPGADLCDVAERCDGVGDGCPPDAFAPSSTVCRPSHGACDPAESCTGSGPACPGDTKSTDECRSAAGPCDPAERCDGVNDPCPADRLAPYGTVCRAAAGVCDAVEKCTGSSAQCPADAKHTGTCRPSIDVCDVPEVCDGVHDVCPPDGFAPTTVTCRAAIGTCDLQESCSGTAPACPPDLHKPAGTVCHASTGTCDPEEVCDGSSATCPPDALSLAGASCPDDGNPCTTDTCNGSSPACTHPPGNAGAVCRPASANQCDAAERCTGTSAACPPDGVKPAGTVCTADADVCTVDQCDADGICSVVGDSTDPSCGFCGEFAVGACAITVDGVAGVFTSLQAAVNAAPNGTTIHVTGVCKGITLVKKRSNLTIEGVAPATCPPGPRDLTATLQGDPNAVLPSGSNGEVIKVLSSDKVVVRYLNIVKGNDDGLEFKTSTNGTAFCNCVARNADAIELDAPGAHVARQCLVTHNTGFGIRVHGGQVNSHVLGNVSEMNADGIGVTEASHNNEIAGNVSRSNALSGILLDNGDANTVTGNDVHDNVVAGIRLKSGADGNTISGNTIANNGDGLTNSVLCVGNLTGNAGTNVPATPACQ